MPKMSALQGKCKSERKVEYVPPFEGAFRLHPACQADFGIHPAFLRPSISRNKSFLSSWQVGGGCGGESKSAGLCSGELLKERLNSNLMTYTRIITNPNQMGGAPCIRGLRIPVATVVGMIADGMKPEEILGAYPDLEKEDIVEALQYAAETVRERELPLANRH